MELFSRFKYLVHFFYHVLQASYGMITGMWKLTRVPQPAITFFGGTLLTKDDPHVHKICELAKLLAKHGFSIITGGGPGVMEAANLGALKSQNKQIVSAGIGIASLQKNNKHIQAQIMVKYFFI